MAIFEMRTYQVITGKMAEASALYAQKAMPALTNGGFDSKLVGYFISDTGMLHQLVHLWKFDDDADRRNFWAALYVDAAFMEFAGQIRPLLVSQHKPAFQAGALGPTTLRSSWMGLHQDARYVVIFKSRIKPEVPGYYELADDLEQLAMDEFRCVARENFRNPNREGVSLSYWQSLDDIKAWKEAAKHRMAHKIGSERWYEDYALEICEIHRSYQMGDHDLG